MKTKTSIALAAAAMLSCATVAAAAGMSHSSSTSTMARPASEMLNLTSTQRKTAWNDLNRQASEQTLPLGFNATVGATVPSAFKLELVPSKTARDIPTLKSYDFAMTQGKLLIVNPSDKKIAEVITK